MKSSRFNRFLVSSFPRFLAATVVCVTSAAYADIATKSGTGTNLVDAASWSGGSGPGFPTSADVATWDNSSLGAGLIVGSAVNWGSIDITGALTNISITGAGAITTGNITLTGDKTLSIANNIILSGNSIYNIADVTASTVTDATLSGPVSGAFDITKSGAGTLEISGLLGGGTYANNLAVNAGTLILTNPGAQTLSGVISGSGTLTLKTPAGTGAAGSVTIGGASSNTFNGTLNIDSNGNTNSTFRTITFNKTGGAVAIGDNAVINFGVGTTGQTNLRMSQNEQFGSGVVMNFLNASGQWARFDLKGTTQTLAGINAGTETGQGGAVIQNQGIDAVVPATNATLTLNGSGTYLFNGHFRDQDNSGTTRKLILIKDGTGTQTLVGNVIKHTGATTINNGVLRLKDTTAWASNISLGASNTPKLQLDGTWTLGNIISGGSANASVEKIGTGTVTLTAANTYTGGTIVSGGTLALNYTTQNNDKIASNSSLTFGGGSLSVTGHASAATTQSVAGTTLNSGSATLTVTKNASTQDTTLNLNTITRNAGGTMNVVYAGTGTGTASVTTDNLNDTTGILGGWATVGGSDWAINSTEAPDGRITAYTDYSETLVGTAMSDTLNQKLTGSLTLTGAHTHNSLKIENPVASQSLALGTNLLTLNSGGLLVTGTNAYTISGTAGATRLTAGNGSGAYDLIVHQYNTGGLTISAVIGDNGGNATNLIKAGTGTLTLTGENTYTGTTTIGAGTLQIGNNGTTGNLSAGAVTNHGTLVFNRSDFITIDNVISGTGALTKQGAGTLTLTNANSYTGMTTISGGTLALSGGNNRLASIGSVRFGGSAIFDVGNTTQTLETLSTSVGNFTTTITGSGGSINVTSPGTMILVTSGTGSNQTSSMSIGNATVTFSPTSTVRLADQTSSGNATSTATLTLNSGGTLNTGNLVLAYSDYTNGNGSPSGVATVNINNGGTLSAKALTMQSFDHQNNTKSATINLNDGGTLLLGTLSAGSTSSTAWTNTINFNGGTIKNYDSSTDLLINTLVGTTHPFTLGTAGTPTFDISSARKGTVNEVMLGAGSLTKIGAGTLILNAANIYAGITTVEQGTLSLGASGAISSTLVLGSDDGDLGSLDVTLKGSFSQANVSGRGTLSIGAGKTITVTTELAPGFSPGILTVDGNLALVDSDDSTTVTKMELAGNGGVLGVDSDYVDVTGSFTLAGLLEIISIDGYDLAQVGTYNLFDAASFTGSFASVTVDGQSLGNFADNTWSASYDNYTYSFNQSDGVLTVIPEPAAILLGGLGMLTLLRRRRN